MILADGGWGYVMAGYAVTLGGLGAYSAWVLVRGRRLSKQVPPGERRWM